MSHTDFAVRHAKATGRKYTLRDSLGLFLHVTATGGRAWHFRYFLIFRGDGAQPFIEAVSRAAISATE